MCFSYINIITEIAKKSNQCNAAESAETVVSIELPKGSVETDEDDVNDGAISVQELSASDDISDREMRRKGRGDRKKQIASMCMVST